MIIANYTPEDVEWQHVGINGIMKSGEVKEYDEGRGNHILNKWGARGLLALKFGDNQDEKKREALAVYKKFWERQITNFNQNNEKRKATQLEYVFPTDQQEKHAKELGMDVLGPWKQKEERGAREQQLADENAELRISVKKANARLDEMMAKFDKFTQRFGDPKDMVTEETPMEKAGAVPDTSKSPIIADDEYLRKQFKLMQKKPFKEWIIDNFAIFNNVNPVIMNEIRQKWLTLFPGEDFPIPI